MMWFGKFLMSKDERAMMVRIYIVHSFAAGQGLIFIHELTHVKFGFSVSYVG
jgi:hypothetical protein